MKGNLLLGTGTGKLGDIVAKVRHGRQILSKYQPNVFNPKSAKQGNQRLLFGFGIQLAKNFIGDNLRQNVYATQRGTSKSIFTNVSQLGIYGARFHNGDLDALNKLDLPIMVNTINEQIFGNDFAISAIKEEIVPLIEGAEPTGTKIYFGSISPILGTNLICKILHTNTATPTQFTYSITKNPMVNVEVAGFEKPKAYGFKNSNEDCGNWPFIYEVTLTANKEIAILESPYTKLIGADNISKGVIHLVMTTKYNEAIGYSVITNPTELPPTP